MSKNKGVRSKKHAESSSMAKTIFGMTIILLTFFAFLIVVTGFSALGENSHVQAFFLGIFGYNTFPLFFGFVIFGLALIFEHRVLSKNFSAKACYVAMIILAVTLIVQTAQTAQSFNAETHFDDYVKACYELGKSGFSCAAGGIIGACIVFPIAKLLSPALAYVLYSLVILVFIAVLFKTPLVALIGKVKDAKREAPPKKKRDKKPAEPVEDGETMTVNVKKGKPVEVEPEPQKHTNAYFTGEFGMKSKRDRSASTPPQSMTGGSFILRSDSNQSSHGSYDYGSSYNKSFNEKVEYIKTPAPFDPSSLGQSPMRAGNVSKPVSTGDRLAHGFDGSVSNADVYVVSDSPASGRSRNLETPDTAVYTPTQRGGLFDSAPRRTSRDDTMPSDETLKTADAYRLSRTNGATRSPDSFGGRPADFGDSANETGGRKLTETRVPDMTGDRIARVDRREPDSPTFDANGKKDDFSNVQLDDIHTFGEPTVPDKKPSATSTRTVRTPIANQTADDVTTVESVKTAEPRREASETVKPVQPTVVSKTPVQEPTMPQPAPVEPEESDDGSLSIEEMPLHYKYHAPSIDLLPDLPCDKVAVAAEHERLKTLAENVVTNFGYRGIELTLVNIVYGMAVTRFEYTAPPTVQLSKITSANKDISMWLEAGGELTILAPIPGTSRIGIEVPNKVRTNVSLKELLKHPKAKELPRDKDIYFAVGKNLIGDPVYLNLTEMPHLLVAGATGTGKSVFLNSMLVSLLYRYTPEDFRMVIVDPKFVEFVEFEGMPHLLFNKILTDEKETVALLKWLCDEMKRRFTLIAAARVKKISEYNKIAVANGKKKMPYIIVLIDEFAELMQRSASIRKEMEDSIQSLAQLARAAGISLVFATQRPSADIMDGTIKTNFPARICFRTSDGTNSMIVLGEPGAEKLIGKGDMLMKISGPTERSQGAYVDTPEIQAITQYIRDNNVCYYDKSCQTAIDNAVKDMDAPQGSASESVEVGSGGGGSITLANPSTVPDEYRRAMRAIIVLRTTSKSMLQTKLGIGYNKAARIIDWLEKEGCVSPVLENQKRDIRITRERYSEIFGEEFNEEFN